MSTSLSLAALAGVGWACGFAATGLGLFAGHADSALAGAVFAAFGFVAGAACTVLRLAFEQQLPMELAASLRRGGEGTDLQPEQPEQAAGAETASAFGA